MSDPVVTQPPQPERSYQDWIDIGLGGLVTHGNASAGALGIMRQPRWTGDGSYWVITVQGSVPAPEGWTSSARLTTQTNDPDHAWEVCAALVLIEAGILPGRVTVIVHPPAPEAPEPEPPPELLKYAVIFPESANPDERFFVFSERPHDHDHAEAQARMKYRMEHHGSWHEPRSEPEGPAEVSGGAVPVDRPPAE